MLIFNTDWIANKKLDVNVNQSFLQIVADKVKEINQKIQYVPNKHLLVQIQQQKH